MSGKRERRERPHRPQEFGPRLERRGRWWAADLRPWGGTRYTVLRDPKAPGWPGRAKGARTELEEVAREWRWAYVDTQHDDHRRDALDLGAKPTAMEGLVADYLAHLARQRKSPETVRCARAVLQVHLVPAIGRATTADAVTTKRLQRLFDGLADRDYEPSTLKTYRAYLHAFFAWVGERERHAVNPVERVRTPEVAERDVTTFDEHARGLLRDAADRIDREGLSAAVRAELGDRPLSLSRLGKTVSIRRALELGLATGGRQGELFALTEGAFREAERTVRFTAQLDDSGVVRPLKGKAARFALVLPDWWTWHQRATPGDRTHPGRRVLDSGYADSWVARAAKVWIRALYGTAAHHHAMTAVPSGVGWHALRHTYARQFLEQGGRLEELRKSLGHKSIVTTERYYEHFTTDRAAAAAGERIYAGLDSVLTTTRTTQAQRGSHAG